MRDFIKVIVQLFGCAILGCAICALAVFTIAICETFLMM